VLRVEQWAEVRRMHLVEKVPIKEIARRTGLARNTVRAALRSERPPHYERTAGRLSMTTNLGDHGRQVYVITDSWVKPMRGPIRMG
jgi:hypothetical protein